MHAGPRRDAWPWCAAPATMAATATCWRAWRRRPGSKRWCSPPRRRTNSGRRAPRTGGMAGRRRPRASLRGRCAVRLRRHRRWVVRHGLSSAGARRDAGGDPRHQCGPAPGAGARHSLGCRCRQRRGGTKAGGARRNHAELRGLQVRTVPRRRPRTCRRGDARRSRRGGAGAARVHCRSCGASTRAISRPRCRAARATRTRDPAAACWWWAAARACRARCAWRRIAALRVGAGLVTRGGRRREPGAGERPPRPSSSIYRVSSVTNLDEALRAANVLAVGPGLGTGEWAQRLWSQVLRGARRAARIPTVVDADALNLLAHDPVKLPAGLDHHAASRRGRAAARCRDPRRAGRPARRRARAACALRRGQRAQGSRHAGREWPQRRG